MKTLIIITLALLLLLIACVVAVDYIEVSAKEIIAMVNSLDDAIDAGRWEEAKTLFRTVYDKWQTVEKRWKIIINHDDMRDIQLGFVDLAVTIAQQDQKEANKELSTLRYYLSHVPENERVDLGNVL